MDSFSVDRMAIVVLQNGRMRMRINDGAIKSSGAFSCRNSYIIAACRADVESLADASTHMRWIVHFTIYVIF